MHRFLLSPHGFGLRRGALLITGAGLALAGLAAAPAAGSASTAARAPAGARSQAAPRPPLRAQAPLAMPHASPLPADVRRVCPLPTQAGQMECMALQRTNTRHYLGIVPHIIPPGYGPADLQSAYNLASASSTGGVGETVAVVDAFNDPNAASDLAVYRAQYSLPACNTATGAGCVSIVNEQGQPSPLPAANASWAVEISLDLDMVSAICPNCHILLVEATTNSLADLGTADNTAVTAGALFVSDGWNGAEFPTENFFDNVYFNHPGVAIAVASHDSGYGTGWPSATQYVTSVGGTTLKRDPTAPRGWDETAWGAASGPGPGSGCSSIDFKPPWQTADAKAPTGCLNRTENDVAAVADPNTGVATYNTYLSGGWGMFGGTSVATPIITSVYALAGNPTPNTYPASYPYQSASSAALYDVTSGTNGVCEPVRQYLCNAETGYDGPTGMGTPNGTAAFANTTAGDVVTVQDPGSQDFETGTVDFIQMKALDSVTGQTLSYSWAPATGSTAGLPPGLTLSSSTGRISGVAGTTGNYPVTVTATDGSGASGSVTFDIIVTPSLVTSFHPVTGPALLDLGGKCIDDAGNGTVNGNKIQIWTCNGGASQKWTYTPDGNPGGAGTLTNNGKCLDIVGRGTTNNTKIDLYRCNSGANQQWYIVGTSGWLYNPASGRCLTDPGGSRTNGTQLVIFDCTQQAAYQAWILPASPVQSGIAGKCVDDAGNGTTNGNKIQLWNCNGKTSQDWTIEPDNTIRINGKCLDVQGRSKLDGALVQLFTCNSNPQTNLNQHWVIGPGGQIVNQNSGRCLKDPRDITTNGIALEQEDCYGAAGEVWATS